MKTPESTLPETRPTVKLSPRHVNKFWSKTNKKGPDDCWEWTGSFFSKTKEQGYGRMSVGGKGRKVHRISWIIHNGQIPEEMCVCHHCDNRKCVNPKHLWLGTVKQNIEDRDRKGRGKDSRGEGNSAAVFQEFQVVRVRQLFDEGMSRKAIASIYKMPQGRINKVISRSTWKHI